MYHVQINVFEIFINLTYIQLTLKKKIKKNFILHFDENLFFMRIIAHKSILPRFGHK